MNQSRLCSPSQARRRANIGRNSRGTVNTYWRCATGASTVSSKPERFAANYRKAGGVIEMLYIEQAARQTAASFDPIAAFFHQQMPVERESEAMRAVG